MSVFAEFHLPTDAFALHQTFEDVPGVVIEVERVVATDEILTPYFWVSGSETETFEAAATADPSVERLSKIDELDDSVLYRANWTQNIESVVFAYLQTGAVVLEAKGAEGIWELQMRFDDHENLEQFHDYCIAEDLQLELQRVHDVSNPKTTHQYGLTEKQRKALVTAWEADYFEIDSGTTLADVATELGISKQALSTRLHRGHDELIEDTLAVTPPE